MAKIKYTEKIELLDKVHQICQKHKCHKGCPLAIADIHPSTTFYDCGANPLIVDKNYSALKKLIEKIER